MVSATFPQAMQALAGQFMSDYVFLSVGRVGATTESISQQLEYVEEHDKRAVLSEILGTLSGMTLVFVETKKTAELLVEFLYRNGQAAVSIHGDKAQAERERALGQFKSGMAPILVATDVAARGLDINNIANVINFDTPNHIDDYVHRIGRTGRAGKQGKAISFINEKNKPVLKALMGILGESG